MVRISVPGLIMLLALVQPGHAQICPAGSTLVVSSVDFSSQRETVGRLVVNAVGTIETRRQLFRDFVRSEWFGPGKPLSKAKPVEFTAPVGEALQAMRKRVEFAFANVVDFHFQLLSCSVVNAWTAQSLQRGLCTAGRRKLGFHVQTGSRIVGLDPSRLPYDPATCRLRNSAEYVRSAAPAVTAPPLKRSMSHCRPVNARNGWQRLSMQPSKIEGIRTRGAWSVDAGRFAAVGPEGHLGSAAVALAPYSKYKIAGKEPFGALLLRLPDGRLASYSGFKGLLARAAASGSQIAFNGQWIDFRINDSDASLGDNDGFITVCIEVK